MAKSSIDVSQTDIPAKLPATDKGGGGSPPKLRGMDSNPQGAFGPRFWQAFRDTVTHIYDSVSLPDPSEEARFTLATRTYPTPRAVLMRCQGTAFTMTRGPAMVARGGDQLIILLQLEGSVDTDSAGQLGRREPGDIAISDYARPFHAAATDYANLILVLPRDSVPAALLALEPHGLVFPSGSGAARLIGAALQEFYAQADNLTVSEAEAAVEGIVALTTASARARLAGDEADRVKSRRMAALDHIDAHLGNAQLGPDEIADAANVSRASLYRLLAAEGRHSRRAVEAPARAGSAAHAGRQQGRAFADGHRQVLRLWRHEPVQPGVSARASAHRRGSTSHSSVSRTSTGTKRGSSPTVSIRRPSCGGKRG